MLAPATWILCGAGFDRDLTGRALDNGSGPETIGGPLLLLLAGAAYAILLFAPISPAGPLLAGVLLLGIGIFARFARDAYADLWPAGITKGGFDLSTPGYGLTLLLAVPLICTALSARRWAAYEPPHVIFLGTLGKARGQARAYGTPIAAESTTVFAADSDFAADPHAESSLDEQTTLLSALFAESASETGAVKGSAAESDSEAAEVLATGDTRPSSGPARPSPGEATVAITRPAIDADRTQALQVGAFAPTVPDEERTTTVVAIPTQRVPDREQTTRIIPLKTEQAPAKRAAGTRHAEPAAVSGTTGDDPGDVTTVLAPIKPAGGSPLADQEEETTLLGMPIAGKPPAPAQTPAIGKSPEPRKPPTRPESPESRKPPTRPESPESRKPPTRPESPESRKPLASDESPESGKAATVRPEQTEAATEDARESHQQLATEEMPEARPPLTTGVTDGEGEPLAAEGSRKALPADASRPTNRTTVAGLESPADEAAEDTGPLTVPDSGDEPTRRL